MIDVVKVLIEMGLLLPASIAMWLLVVIMIRELRH